jgi:hypothetical protein
MYSNTAQTEGCQAEARCKEKPLPAGTNVTHCRPRGFKYECEALAEFMPRHMKK